MPESSFSIGEMRLIVASFLALVIINGLFFGTGIFGDELDNTVPTIDNASFENDVINAGTFPNRPSSVARGIMMANPSASQPNIQREPIQVGKGSGGNDVWMHLYKGSATHHGGQHCTGFVHVDLRNSSEETPGALGAPPADPLYAPASESRVVLCGEGDTATIDSNLNDPSVDGVNNYTIDLQRLTDGPGDGVGGVQVEYVIRSRQTDQSGNLLDQFLSSIPIVSGIVSASSDLAGFVLWIGEVFLWASTLFFELLLSLLLFFASMINFTIQLGGYLVTGWTKIHGALAGTSPWLSLLVFAPQIGMFLVLFNGVAKGVKMLPWT